LRLCRRRRCRGETFGVERGPRSSQFPVGADARFFCLRVRGVPLRVRGVTLCLRALEFFASVREIFLRTCHAALRAGDVGPGPLKIGLRAHDIALCTLEIRLCLFEVAEGPLEIRLHAIAIRVRTGQIGLHTLKIGLRVFELAVGPLEIGLRALTVRVRTLTVCLRAFELGAGALQIRVCAFAFGLRAFQIRLRPRALRGDRFLELAACLQGRVGGRLFSLDADALGLGRHHALDLGAYRRNLRLEVRVPLAAGLVEPGGRALFGGSLGVASGLLDSFLMCFGETAEMGLELSLQARPYSVDDCAELILDHTFALCEAGSSKSSTENAATSSPTAT
jgi:hypothetical protein